MLHEIQFKADVVDSARHAGAKHTLGTFICPGTILDPEEYLRRTLGGLGIRLQSIQSKHERVAQLLLENEPDVRKHLERDGHYIRQDLVQ
jgi:hypothetical protein